MSLGRDPEALVHHPTCDIDHADRYGAQGPIEISEITGYAARKIAAHVQQRRDQAGLNHLELRRFANDQRADQDEQCGKAPPPWDEESGLLADYDRAVE